MMNIETLPEFFSNAPIPSVAKWAADKAKQLCEDVMECQGQKVLVNTWMFEGRFARTPNHFSGQWASKDGVEQYTCRVNSTGGQYRGQKACVTISFTKYTAIDGKPLPV